MAHLGLQEIRHINLYDSFDLDEIVLPRYTQLFSNRNVGNSYLTNLQIAGQLPSECWFIVQRWYARTNIPERDKSGLDEALRIWANSVVIEFIIGNRPEWQLSLFDLIDRRPRVPPGEQQLRLAGDPWPTVVPPRQHFLARINSFGESVGRLLERVTAHGKLDGTAHPTGARIWLHLEGLEVRTDGDYRGVYEIMKGMTNVPREHMAVEEQVAAWLRGMAIKNPSPEDRGLIDALRDGILEGKHRGS